MAHGTFRQRHRHCSNYCITTCFGFLNGFLMLVSIICCLRWSSNTHVVRQKQHYIVYVFQITGSSAHQPVQTEQKVKFTYLIGTGSNILESDFLDYSSDEMTQREAGRKLRGFFQLVQTLLCRYECERERQINTNLSSSSSHYWAGLHLPLQEKSRENRKQELFLVKSCDLTSIFLCKCSLNH